MSKLQKWISKTIIKTTANDVIERNTGDSILVQGNLNDVFCDATLITKQDITCSVDEIDNSIRLAFGKHILEKKLSRKPIKGAFAEVVAAPEKAKHFLTAITAIFGAMPQNTNYCIAIKTIENQPEELTLWITN